MMKRSAVALFLLSACSSPQQPVKVETFSLDGTIQRTQRGTIAVPEDAWKPAGCGAILEPHAPALAEDLTTLESLSGSAEADSIVSITVGDFALPPGQFVPVVKSGEQARMDFSASFELESTSPRVQATLAHLQEEISGG